MRASYTNGIANCTPERSQTKDIDFALYVYGWNHPIPSAAFDLAERGLFQPAFAWVIADHDCQTGGRRCVPATMLDMIGFFLTSLTRYPCDSRKKFIISAKKQDIIT